MGYKKVGKTKLIENLIPELSSRGYSVGTVKHHHSDYPVTVDSTGTDTWRHRNAGAKSVALVTPTNLAMFSNTETALSLDQITSTFAGHDVVLVEGFHRERKAKIEVLSPHSDERLCSADGNLLAVVTATEHDEVVPCFSPDDIGPLADLIETKILGQQRH